MVEYSLQLDSVFHSLSDPIRRDMLYRVTRNEACIGELATQYNVSFAAISKHLKVLEKAKLIRKRKEGRNYIVTPAYETLKEANDYLEQYRRIWQSRYDRLDVIVKENPHE